MKRFVSWVLIVVLSFSSVLMAGCASAPKITFSLGQWLALVNNEFGMSSYIQETPYFSNVTSDNPYFGTVQIAAEWDVIDSKEKIDINAPLTWEQALITLVNVGNFMAEDATDEDKVAYATEHFDNTIRDYWMNRSIDVENAIYLLGIAQEQWANRKYDTMIEEVAYQKDVVDFTQEETKITEYKEQGNETAIPLSSGIDLKIGQIYILPPNAENMEPTIHKVASTYTDGDYLYIVNDDDNIELGEVVEELYVEGTYEPAIEQMVIYDGNGNIISSGTQVINGESLSTASGVPSASFLGNANGNSDLQSCGFDVSHSFEVDGYKVSLKYGLNGKLDLSASVETPNLLGKNAKNEIKGNLAVSIKNLEVSQKVDIEWFKLKEASLKVDYETAINAGLKFSSKIVDKVAAPAYSNGNGYFKTNLFRSVLKDKGAFGAQTIASKKTVKICSLNIYNAAVAKVCLDVNLQIAADGSVSVNITESGTKGLEFKNGNLRVINTCDKDIDFEVKGKIEATLGMGPALYVVGLKKKVLGVELRVGVGAEAAVTTHLTDGKKHLIESSGSDSGITPEACDGLQYAEIQTTAEDIAAVAKSQGYIIDAATLATLGPAALLLQYNFCVDVKGYFILKIGLSDEAYATEFLGSKVKVNWEICGSKNSVFVHAHIDNFDWNTASIEWGSGKSSNLCTLEFASFEDMATEEIEVEADAGNVEGELPEGAFDVEISGGFETDQVQTTDINAWGQEVIVISDMKLDIDINASKILSVEQLPSGYTMADIVFSSADEKVAKVNSNGVILGVSAGNTMIAVSTKDGKYAIYCAVTVYDSSEVDFEGLATDIWQDEKKDLWV